MSIDENVLVEVRKMSFMEVDRLLSNIEHNDTLNFSTAKGHVIIKANDELYRKIVGVFVQKRKIETLKHIDEL